MTSEIDVTKCGAYDEGKCYADECGTTHAYCEDNKSCHYKQVELLKIENKNLKKVVEFQRDRYYLSTRGEEVKKLEEKLEKIKEIIKIDIEHDNMTLQEFSKMSYFSLSPKGKVLQNILDTVMKETKEV